MRLALFSDIHSNMNAFEACLSHAQNQSIDQIAILGDLVGYGAQPKEVIAKVMALKNLGAIVLRGNHEEALFSENINSESRIYQSNLWTKNQLSNLELEFLKFLPLSHQINDVLLVHSNSDQPEKWHYLDNPVAAKATAEASKNNFQARITFVGHVHHQSIFYQGAGRGMMNFVPTPEISVPLFKNRNWVITIGSVGQPRDNNPQAMYAIYDFDKDHITFYRIIYNINETVEKIIKAGLPEFFASRLKEGK